MGGYLLQSFVGNRHGEVGVVLGVEQGDGELVMQIPNNGLFSRDCCTLPLVLRFILLKQ